MANFGLAFKEARKQGLKKFKYNNNWYTTELAEDKKAASHNSLEKTKLNLKTSKAVRDSSGKVIGAKNLNKLLIIKQNSKNGPLYALMDVDTGMIYNSGKDANALQKWAVDNLDSIGIPTVEAQHRKLNRHTPGYLPVDSSNLKDNNGNSRVYTKNGTGLAFVVDNYNNIIADSFDPNATKNGFNGWVINTGTKRDLERTASGDLRNRSNMNEVNQKSQQKLDRLLDDRNRQMLGLLNLLGATNMATSMINLPNNIITGALRTLRDDYTTLDYLDSFSMDNAWKGEKQSVGLGDLLGVENSYGKFAANLINPMSLSGIVAGANKTVTQNKPVRFRAPNHEMRAYEYRTPGVSTADPTRGLVRYIGNDMPSLKGQYIGNIEGKGSLLPPSGAKSTEFSTLGRNFLVTTKGNGPARIQSPEIIQFKYSGVSKNTPQVKNFNFKTGQYSGHNGDLAVKDVSHVGTYPIEGTFSSYMPGAKTTHYHLGSPYLMNGVYNFTPRNKSQFKEEPLSTANFLYDGKDNKTVQGRIKTGNFIPGSTSPEWKSVDSNVEVNNGPKHISPMFGGKTSGVGKDNQSNLYLYGRYKVGGKLNFK